MTQDPHSISTLEDVRVIDLGRHDSHSGKLTVVENGTASKAPFAVKRIFYLYDVPSDSERGGHSHFEGQELMVAVSGAFDVELDDGIQKKRWRLDKPYLGLYIPTGIWRTMDNFSGGAVCLVMTSTDFTETDYVRDYDKFKELTTAKR